jgi:hypothetical protein
LQPQPLHWQASAASTAEGAGNIRNPKEISTKPLAIMLRMGLLPFVESEQCTRFVLTRIGLICNRLRCDSRINRSMLTGLKRRLTVLRGAKQNIGWLYAGVAFLALVALAEAWPLVAPLLSKWIKVPQGEGPVTLFGIPMLAWSVGGFGLLFGIWMWEHAYRLTRQLEPELAWFYDDREPDCNKKVGISEDEGKTTYSGRSIRLKVFCHGGVNVEQCSGFLTRIQYRAFGGLFSDIPFYEPGYLRWALEEPQPSYRLRSSRECPDI